MALDDFTTVRGDTITHPIDTPYKGGGGTPHLVAQVTPTSRDFSVFDRSASFSPFQSATTYQMSPAQHSALSSQPVLPTSNTTSGHGNAGSQPLQGVDVSTAISMEQAMKSGVMSHLDGQLAALYQGDAGAPQSTMLTGMHHYDNAVYTGVNGHTYVTVDITAANGDGASLVSALDGLGMTQVSSYAGIASGVIDATQIKALGDLLNTDNLGFARESSMGSSAVSNQGFVVGQQDHAETADQARADFGVDGSGVRIGLLSDSFDTDRHAKDYLGNADHMAQDIASGDLPEDTNDYADSAHGTDEGRAMAQLAHDIAPGSGIDFATAFSGEAGFANNIVGLAQAGDKVISDDVQYFAELAYQQGPIAQAVNYVTQNYGVSYFSSAGNNGHQGLEENWVGGGPWLANETLMQFAPGQDYLPVTLAAGEVFILQWDQPGASAGGPGSASDLDLFLTNKDGSVIYAVSADNNIGGDPVEGFQIGGGAGNTYYLRVGLYSGPAPTEIKLMALGNGAPVVLDPDHTVGAANFNNGTLYGHAAAEDANAVGAVRYDATPAWGTNPPDSESFTSAGNDHILFDDAGNRLADADLRDVSFSAADGANTTFFFAGDDYESDGFPNFFGTSAASPSAGAVAALMMQANLSLTASDIHNLLADSALDMDDNNQGGTPAFDNGPDSETGAGFIQADAAVRFASTLVIQNDDAVVLTGTHLNDTIIGNGNANTIYGGDGDDIIQGSIRGDFMYGGAGADTFVFSGAFDSISHIRIDHINDLENIDTIDVSGLDADQTTPGDQAFTLIHHKWHGTPGELQVVYHKHGQYAGDTTLKGFENGDHTVDFFVVIDGKHVDFSNFIL